jgi:hypothetical protein
MVAVPTTQIFYDAMAGRTELLVRAIVRLRANSVKSYRNCGFISLHTYALFGEMDEIWVGA